MSTFKLLYETFKYNIFYRKEVKNYFVKLVSKMDKDTYTILSIEGEAAKIQETNISDYENGVIVEQNIRMILLALEEVEEEKAMR